MNFLDHCTSRFRSCSSHGHWESSLYSLGRTDCLPVEAHKHPPPHHLSMKAKRYLGHFIPTSSTAPHPSRDNQHASSSPQPSPPPPRGRLVFIVCILHSSDRGVCHFVIAPIQINRQQHPHSHAQIGRLLGIPRPPPPLHSH